MTLKPLPSRLTAALLALALLAGCGKKEEAPASAMAVAASAPMPAAAPAPMEEMAADKMMAPPAPPPPPPSEPLPPPSSGVAAEVQQRVIIRNAELTLVVTDARAQLQPIAAVAARFGGFVTQSSFSRATEGPASGQVSLKVRAAQLDAALEALRKLAVDVRDENVHSEDVTGEYVDLQARLRNLQSAEAQLHEIMKQAKKTEDVMSVFGQLTQTRGEIEQAQARIKYLSESAALSSIQLQLVPDALATPVRVAGWQPVGEARRAVDMLIATLQGLGSLLIWAAIVGLPLLLVLGLPLRWWLRRRRRRKPA